MSSSGVLSDIYGGLTEVGFPLTVVSATVATFVSVYIIRRGMQIKRGLVNPPPSVPSKDGSPPTPDEVGNLLIGAGVAVIVVSWLWSYLAYKYKAISAIAAVGSLFTMVSSVVHMKRNC